MYRVSVIMGIYNCGETLESALQSLESQTFKDEDGSHDNTLEIARKYASTHKNVILLVNDRNMGLNYTLNRCLSYVDTEYVARMDGDDYSLPIRFEKEITFLDTHPEYAVVSSSMIRFDDNGDFMTDNVIERPSKKDLIKGCPISHPACMARTEAIRKVGGYSVEDKLLRQEDYHLWIKLYAAGFKAYNIKEPLYRFRDDMNAYKRRNWLDRKNEMYVVNLGVNMLDLPFYYKVIALRPLIAYIIPRWLYNIYHRKSK